MNSKSMETNPSKSILKTQHFIFKKLSQLDVENKDIFQYKEFATTWNQIDILHKLIIKAIGLDASLLTLVKRDDTFKYGYLKPTKLSNTRLYVYFCSL